VHTASIKDVAEAAGTSPATVSRVLNSVSTVDPILAERVHAAVKRLNYKPNQAGRNLRMGFDAEYGPTFEFRQQRNREIKQRIARRVAEFLHPPDIVVLDSGSTVAQIVPYLPNDVLLYTNSLAILQPAAKRGLHIHLAPGLYVPPMAAVFGSETEQYFSNRKPTKYILSSTRVDVRTGLYNVNRTTAMLKQVVMRQAETSILLVDHEKFCDAELTGYAPLSDVDILVTDFVPEQFREALEQSGVTVIEIMRNEGDNI